MLGVGQGLTARSVLGRIAAGVGATPVSYALAADDAIDAHLRPVEDGIEVVVAAPDRFAGTYIVTLDDIRSGLPVWLMPPSVEETSSRRWTVRDDGLLLYPEETRVVVHVGWEIDEEPAASGTAFEATQPGKTDAEVALIVAAANVNGRAVSRSIVAEAVRYKVNEVVFRNEAHLVGSLGNRPDAARLVVLWNGVLTGPESVGLLAGRRSADSEPFVLNTRQDGSSGAHIVTLQLPLVYPDGTEIIRQARSQTVRTCIPVGKRATCLIIFEQGEQPVIALSVDGGAFEVERTYRPHPEGTLIPMAMQTVLVGRNFVYGAFTGRMSCTRLWVPKEPVGSLAEDTVFQSTLRDVEGLPKPARLQTPYLGEPLLDLSADAATYARGAGNAGTAGPFTIATGTIEDHSE